MKWLILHSFLDELDQVVNLGVNLGLNVVNLGVNLGNVRPDFKDLGLCLVHLACPSVNFLLLKEFDYIEVMSLGILTSSQTESTHDHGCLMHDRCLELHFGLELLTHHMIIVVSNHGYQEVERDDYLEEGGNYIS